MPISIPSAPTGMKSATGRFFSDIREGCEPPCIKNNTYTIHNCMNNNNSGGDTNHMVTMLPSKTRLELAIAMARRDVAHGVTGGSARDRSGRALQQQSKGLVNQAPWFEPVPEDRIEIMKTKHPNRGNSVHYEKHNHSGTHLRLENEENELLGSQISSFKYMRSFKPRSNKQNNSNGEGESSALIAEGGSSMVVRRDKEVTKRKGILKAQAPEDLLRDIESLQSRISSNVHDLSRKVREAFEMDIHSGISEEVLLKMSEINTRVSSLYTLKRQIRDLNSDAELAYKTNTHLNAHKKQSLLQRMTGALRAVCRVIKKYSSNAPIILPINPDMAIEISLMLNLIHESCAYLKIESNLDAVSQFIDNLIDSCDNRIPERDLLEKKSTPKTRTKKNEAVEEESFSSPERKMESPKQRTSASKATRKSRGYLLPPELRNRKPFISSVKREKGRLDSAQPKAPQNSDQTTEGIGSKRRFQGNSIPSESFNNYEHRDMGTSPLFSDIKPEVSLHNKHFDTSVSDECPPKNFLMDEAAGSFLGEEGELINEKQLLRNLLEDKMRVLEMKREAYANYQGTFKPTAHVRHIPSDSVKEKIMKNIDTLSENLLTQLLRECALDVRRIEAKKKTPARHTRIEDLDDNEFLLSQLEEMEIEYNRVCNNLNVLNCALKEPEYPAEALDDQTSYDLPKQLLHLRKTEMIHSIALNDDFISMVETNKRNFEVHLDKHLICKQDEFDPWKLVSSVADNMLSKLIYECAEELFTATDLFSENIFDQEFSV
eukprot:Nk52_evm21s490 gene=Nk52_evmTU21s490